MKNLKSEQCLSVQVKRLEMLGRIFGGNNNRDILAFSAWAPGMPNVL